MADIEGIKHETVSIAEDLEKPGEAEQTGAFAPLHRKLKSRHLQMIAIGGIIGPGLLVGSGNALGIAGPAGILIAFILVGLIVFFVMQSLGEIATLIPVPGSFIDYATRFVDESLAFGLGWAYWYLWLTVIVSEYTAISLVVMYWTDAVPQWGWIIIFWFIFMCLSNLPILAYGEVEFWLALIKVIAILIFFVIAIAISTGGIGGETIGFKYWEDPGAFADGINGVAKIFVYAGTLYAGTEMVGITAGESANPRKAVPKAIRQVFWRILIFFVGMMFFVGILIPYNDERLMAPGSKTGKSPMTLSLSDAGLEAGAHIINALIVVSVFSALNSALYVSSRTLTHMARNGMAPKMLGRTNKYGVPWVALVFTQCFACIAFLSLSSSAGTVYNALLTLAGVSTFIVWATIEVVHIRFRQALKAQGESEDTLPFKAMWYPYGAYAALSANLFLVLFQGYTCFLNPFSSTDMVINYILIPIFIILVGGYKLWHKTKLVKVHDMDIWTGRREDPTPVDEEGKISVFRRIRNVVIS